MSYISKWRLQDNSVVPIGSNLFGTCSSGASDTTKVVSLSAFDVLVEGVTIHVYFANANSGSNTLLQVGSTSAQPIKRNGVAEGKWESGSVISFTYSQGYWVQNDADVGGGGGGGETYTLSKNGDIITLTGSGGDTSSVTDSDTTYTISLNGQTLTLTPSTGSPQSITLPDDDTTYTISINDHTLTLTPSNGTPQTITLPDDSTTYTATSPIDITNDDISHEDSGVTAGTYDGGTSKDVGVYFPSFTVDEKGHITSATDLGTLIPTICNSNAQFYYGNLVTGSNWRYVPRVSSIYDLILGPSVTSATFILRDYNPYYGDDYYIRILSVEAVDADGNAVIVDWSVDYPTHTAGKSNQIRLTVSISAAYGKAIYIKPIIAYGTAGM